jgi:hypothetical protein
VFHPFDEPDGWHECEDYTWVEEFICLIPRPEKTLVSFEVAERVGRPKGKGRVSCRTQCNA